MGCVNGFWIASRPNGNIAECGNGTLLTTTFRQIRAGIWFTQVDHVFSAVAVTRISGSRNEGGANSSYAKGVLVRRFPLVACVGLVDVARCG